MSLLFPYVISDDPDYCFDGCSRKDSEQYQSKLVGRSKQFSNYFETLIRTLGSTGTIQFYGLTINIPPANTLDWQKFNDPNFILDFSSETGDCSISSAFGLPGWTDRKVGAILYTLVGIELLEFVHISQELHKEGALAGRPHYHVFIAVRCLLGTDNEFVHASIQQQLYQSGIVDFRLSRLEAFAEQAAFINFVIKENRRHWQFFYTFSAAYRSGGHADYLWKLHQISTDIGLALGACYDYTVFSVATPKVRDEPVLISGSAYEPYLSNYRRDYHFKPLPGKHVDRLRLEFLIKLACHDQGYYYYRDHVYKRDPRSLNAYCSVYPIHELLDDIKQLLEPLIKRYPTLFFNGVGFVEVALLEHRVSLVERLVKEPSIVISEITKLNHHLIEFRLGSSNILSSLLSPCHLSLFASFHFSRLEFLFFPSLFFFLCLSG